MSIARRNAIISLTLWLVILAGLIASVLGPGVERFILADHVVWRGAVALFVFVGLVLNTWLQWQTRRERRRGDLDERDEAVARQASEATLVVVAMITIIGCLALYTAYLPAGAVPAGWLYLMGYGSMGLVSLVHAAATLVVDLSGQVHG